MKISIIFCFLFLCFCLGPREASARDFAYLDKGNIYAAGNDMPAGRISLDFKDIEIVEALKFLSAKAKINIISTNKVQGRVSLTVEDAPVQDVFTIMLRSHGLAYEKRGEIYNVMSEDEYSKLYGKKFFDTRQVKVFKLNYAIPARVMALCEKIKSELGVVHMNPESGTVVVIDTAEKIKEMQSAITIMEEHNTVIKVFDLQYANAEDIVRSLKSQLDNKSLGTIHSDERTNQVVVETLPDRIGTIEKLITELDKKTRAVLIEVRIIRVSIDDNLSKGVQWEGLFQMAAKYGFAYVGSYPFSSVQSANDPWRSRKTVLQGGLTPDGTLVEPVGYVGSYPFSGTVTGEANYASSKPATGLGNLHVGLIGDHDVDVIFKYLKTVGDVKVVSAPKIAVINNQQAKVHIGERQAYITNTTTQTTSATTVAEDVTFIDVGIQLILTPTINDDGFVTIKINPEVSNVTSFLTTGQGNRIPIVNTSSTETTVLVKDSATLMIGGLKEERATEITEEVPFFSRIPLIGGMFRNSSKTNLRTELLLMVTPYIISGDELVTGSPRDLGIDVTKGDHGYLNISEQKDSVIPKSYREYTTQAETVTQAEKPQLKPMKMVE